MVKPASLPSQQAILAHFDRNDPVVAAVIREIGPCPLRPSRNYFRFLCKAIIAQQISTKAARTITARFHALFDGKVPNPQRLRGLPDGALPKAGLSRQKAKYLVSLSERFLDGTIRPRRLAQLSNEEVIGQLTQVHGVGRWTAEMFLIFSLNRMDVLPVTDLGLQKGIQKMYGLRRLPSVKKMHALGRKWHPLETVATWYAWRRLDPVIVTY